MAQSTIILPQSAFRNLDTWVGWTFVTNAPVIPGTLVHGGSDTTLLGLYAAGTPGSHNFLLSSRSALTSALLNGGTLTVDVGGTEFTFDLAVTSGALPSPIGRNTDLFNALLGFSSGTASATLTLDNNLDDAPPALASAGTNASGNQIILTFDRALNSRVVPAAGDFALTGADTGIGRPAIVGSDCIIPLTNAVPGNASILLTYNPGTNRIQSTGGGLALGFADQAVANLSTVADDTTAPSLVTAIVNANLVTLTFDERLDPAQVPPSGSFDVQVTGGGAISVRQVTISGVQVQLSLFQAVTLADALTLAWTAGTVSLRDHVGNAVASIAATPLDNETAPTFTISISGESSRSHGEAANYSATPAGSATGAITYQWQRRSPSASTWDDVATSATYSITEIADAVWSVRLVATRAGIEATSSPIRTEWSATPPDPTTVTAVAGADRSVQSGGTSVLGGVDTITNGAGATTIMWTRVSGEFGQLDDATSATPVFTAPDLEPGADDLVTVWEKQVTNNGVSGLDRVTVTVVAPAKETPGGAGPRQASDIRQTVPPILVGFDPSSEEDLSRAIQNLYSAMHEVQSILGTGD